MARTRRGRSRGSKGGRGGTPKAKIGSRGKASPKERRARKVFRLLQAQIALLTDYTVALADLYAAGLYRMSHPGVPGWYHAQRVIVAAVRRALVQVEQKLHDARAAVVAGRSRGRGRTQPADHHFALRVREGECLLELRDRAKELARSRGRLSRTIPTDDERRLAATRDREELRRLAAEWNWEGAWLMSNALPPVRRA
jgi:hypothetical protein